MKIPEIFVFLGRRVFLLFYVGKLHFFRNFFSSLGLFLTLLVVIILLGLLRPIREALLAKAEKSLPSEMVRIQTSHKSSKIFPLGFLGPQNDVTLGFVEKDIQKIIKMPGVKRVYLSQVLQSPAKATIDHPLVEKLGFTFYFDVLFQGVEKDLVAPYLKCMKDFAPEFEKNSLGEAMPVLPIVVPGTFAEIAYSFAMVYGIGEINPQDFVGLKLKIRLGESTLGIRRGKTSLIMGKICGFVPEGMVRTLGIPLSFVKKLHREFNQKNALSSYDQLFVVFQNVFFLEEFKKKALKEGWQLPPKEKKYDELFRLLNKLDYLFWGIAFILLGLSMLAMANSFALLALEKKYEFGLYLVFGASPIFLWSLIFLEGAFWGLFHVSLSLWAAEKLFTSLAEYFQKIPFFLNLGMAKEASLELSLSGQEKIFLILASSFLGGISSLLPTIFLLGRKTLNLVKKD